MGQARPPRAAVRHAIRTDLADLVPGDRVLVGLSGGPDSLALLAGAVVVAADEGLRCAAVVVDHGLQPESGEVARRAADQARLLGCAEASVVAVEVARGPGAGGIEAAARDARHAALLAAAGPPDPAAAILLGHTRDDQAETVLLGLARGSGTRSLSGMRPRRGLVRRPLLDLPRALVAQAAQEAAAEDPRLTPWQDPDNADQRFTRSRVRRRVLPLLEEELGPGIVDALARTATLARADADALDDWARRVWDAVPAPTLGPGVLAALPGPDVAELPPAVRSRVVRHLLLAAGCPAGRLTADHVLRAAALLDTVGSGSHVLLPGGLRACQEGDRLVVRA